MLPTVDLQTLLAPIAPAPRVRAVIYTGPSLTAERVRQRLPDATVRPPIKRGDLPAAVAEGFDVVGIIDGTYITARTVSAAEIQSALARGVAVYGAASLGALRAVEFEQQGMQGVGVIADWFRRGLTIRDDEVVVTMDPETFAPLGQPLVNLRYACMRARRAGVIDHEAAAVLLERYAAIPFAQRRYSHLFEAVVHEGRLPAPTVQAFERFIQARGDALDLKQRDALALVDRIADAFLLAA